MLLSIDRSLPSASMALFEKDACLAAVASAPVLPPSRPDRPWESLLDDLLAASGAPLSAVDRIVVGLGPGSFSGIRTALAFAKGLVLPAGNNVAGFSSAAAMACEFFHAHPETDRVFLVGDARRDTLWLAGCFRTAPSAEIACLPTDEALSRIAAAPGVPVLSPDFSRLSGKISGLVAYPFDGARPLAQALGELALCAPSLAQVPPVPLYLHPAVRPRPAST